MRLSADKGVNPIGTKVSPVGAACERLLTYEPHDFLGILSPSIFEKWLMVISMTIVSL